MKQRSPVWWANWGPASTLLAKMIRADERPMLVISIPRSGSSWVGEVLGSAPNALYLREPLNQSHLKSGGHHTVFYIDPHSPPENYSRFAATAFLGVPAFSRGIVRDAAQWSLWLRTRKRLVIKEVNPLALPWLIDTYRPAVILLLRHPAAVASSYWDLGWREAEQRLVQLDPNLLDGPLRQWKNAISLISGYWRAHGAFQGAVIRTVIDTLNDYFDYKIVFYEDLCADPETKFIELFEFAKLQRDEVTNQRISESCSATEKNMQHPYGTRRSSRELGLAWKKKLDKEQLEMVRAGYSLFELPYYNSENDWSV